MKMPFIILCQCLDWQPVINDIPCLCWGIIGLVALYLLLRYVFSPLIANCHERVMMKDADTREREWADFKNTKASTDEALQQQVKELKSKVSELEGGLKTEKFNKELLEKQLKLYRDVFEKLNIEVKPKDN